MTSPKARWALRRVLTGHTLNGELDTLDPQTRRIATYLNGLDANARSEAFQTILYGFPKEAADQLVKDVADASDPYGPPPDTVRLTAHLGDLTAVNDSGRFIWPRWIVRGHFTLLTSEPKIGKTRLGLEIAKRLYLGHPWPDGQEPTSPDGTKTLWVPGDRQQDELRELAPVYGLPHEAVLLNADPSDPYGGVSLDDPRNVEALRARAEAERPGLIFVDTVWRATRRKLSREDEVNEVMDPIITIAQELNIAILGMMHASKDGETLGRRLEGLARAVIKLSKPDPDGQPARRRLWVDRANFLEPPPLGVTIHEGGCDFDSSPPTEPEPSRLGRPNKEFTKAIEFVTEALTGGDRKQCELVSAWEALGGGQGDRLQRHEGDARRRTAGHR